MTIDREEDKPLFLPPEGREDMDWRSGPMKWLWRQFSFQLLSPRAKAVCEQLNRRSANAQDVWGDEGYRGRFSNVVKAMAKLAYRWPTDRFLPSDPYSIVTFNYVWDGADMDGCEHEEFYLLLEDLVGRSISELTVAVLNRLTLGEAVDVLLDIALSVPGFEDRLQENEKLFIVGNQGPP